MLAGHGVDAPVSDGVNSSIVEIEMRRLESEKSAGFPLSRSAALHRLQELLDHETEGLRLRGPASPHPANIEVVSAEIGRVKGLSPVAARGPAGRNAYAVPGKVTWRDASYGPAKNKGRRTMGRAGGR